MTQVSVIIPCFNRERYVGEAIESVLSQSHPDLELIVVDDGSTDDSWRVITSFGDRVQAVRSENRGQYCARNRGLSHARGPFVKFLDSDDMLESGIIERQLHQFETLPERGIPVGRPAFIDPVGRHLSIIKYMPPMPPDGGRLPLSTLLYYTLQVSLPLYPKSALDAVGGFREDGGASEDFDLQIRLHLAGYHFHLFETVSSFMREHPGVRGSTHAGADKFRAMIRLFQDTVARLEARGDGLSDDERVAMGRHGWKAAREAARRGLLPEARALFAFGQEMAGRRAQVGSAPMRLLYKLGDPVTCERLTMRMKRLLRVAP